MSTCRPILFWIATFAATTAIVVLLHQVLLPFVAGMVLAYLLDPSPIGSSECVGVCRPTAQFVRTRHHIGPGPRRVFCQTPDHGQVPPRFFPLGRAHHRKIWRAHRAVTRVL